MTQAELVAKKYAQLTEEDKIILKACAKSLEFFVTQILKIVPSTQQLSVIRAIDSGVKKIAIKSGHGTGKTSLISWIVLWFGLFKYDAKIPMTAPTKNQLYDILIPEITKWAKRLPDLLADEVDCQKEKIVFRNGNFAVARTARKEQPEALQGFHADNIFFVLEEASGIPDKIFEVAEGALTSENSYAIMAGNPTRTTGFFYKTFAYPDGIWKLFTFNAEESENVSRQAIIAFQKKYGKDSDVYRVRVQGEFPRGTSNVVIPISIIEEAIARDEYDNSGDEVWALDVADYGDDRSVLAKRKGKYLYGYKVWRNLDLPELLAELIQEYKKAKIKPKAIFIDAIGVGSSLASMAQKAGLKVAIPVKASYKATQKDLYMNARAEWFFRMKEALEDEGKMINDDYFIGELGAITYEINEKGLYQLTSKKKIKQELGRSPDIADAFAMTFAQTYFVDEDVSIDDDELLDYVPLIYNYGGAVW